ncbi:hypothetical protein [Calidithermus chliarophilus]|uniref:hypothetical protein n=1 Tax=Calidithermus chliarophilus TaxID=52023 RepID=UPI00146FBA3A|nr:hypothetical protein [Calidithermus chliarophilus]
MKRLSWVIWAALAAAIAQGTVSLGRYETPGSRVVYFSEGKAGHHYRLYSKAAVGETFLIYARASGVLSSTVPACQTWTYQGILSESFVFELSEFNAARDSASARALIAQAGRASRAGDTRGYAQAVTLLCGSGELGIGPLRTRTVYVPVQFVTRFSTSGMLGRPVVLKLMFNPDDYSLEADLEPR